MVLGWGLAIALGFVTLQAQGAEIAPGSKNVAVTRPPNYASAGNFSTLQFATLDDKKFMAEWAKTTAGVKIEAASRMHPNQTIFTFIAFKGCKPDAVGKCNVTMDFEVFDPTGKSIGQQKGNPVWVGLPPVPNNNIQISTSSLGFSVDDKDPLGPYKVMVIVTDHVSGVSLKTEQTLTATAT